MIEHYSFGRIVVDGKAYTSDLIIFPNRVKSYWWRKEGHKIHVEDLIDALEAKPDVLIIGTGYLGLVRVPEDVKRHLAERGIELMIKPTKEACNAFNELLRSGKKAIAALHLTC